MKEDWRIPDRILQIQKSAIHEMTRLSKEIEDAAFLSWAKPTSDTPEHIKEATITCRVTAKASYFCNSKVS